MHVSINHNLNSPSGGGIASNFPFPIEPGMRGLRRDFVGRGHGDDDAWMRYDHY